MNGHVGWGGLAIAVAVVLVAAGLSRAWRLGLERDVLVAIVRSLAQMLLVAVALGLIVADGVSIWWSWLWVVAMVGFAAVTMRRRAPALPGLLRISLLATGTTAAVGIAITFGIGIFPVEPRTLVPVAGMLVGNSMSAGVVACRRLSHAIGERRDEVEARLALGQPWPQAARPLLREILRTAITPQIESTKALGIVFLPGAMTGLILAGVDPLDAVLVQLALMYVILGGVVTMTTVTTVAAARRLFTRDHRLRPLPRMVD
ncbi:ABC transporter permease [Patulibacter defluvii]|uniref:ABC transporter permease n=1 Tax=Patulibacter defluvii TaxID=3095358 RepID=UPI002A749681|nr:ABC transporter permease [Patulibacter sp. DM4]